MNHEHANGIGLREKCIQSFIIITPAEFFKKSLAFDLFPLIFVAEVFLKYQHFSFEKSYPYELITELCTLCKWVKNQIERTH